MILLTLRDAVDRHFADALAEPSRLLQDALIVALKNGATLELRFAGPGEYAIGWRWGDAELCIDTAPMHPALATFPNHWHDADGEMRADPLTHPCAEPWDNARAVIDAVLADPLLRALGAAQ